MLRAANTIKIDTDSLTGNNGFILALNVCINGVYINATKKIESRLVDFFAKHGFKLNRVRYRGDMLVKIQCNGALSRAKFEQFVTEHKLGVPAAGAKTSVAIAAEVKNLHQQISQKKQWQIDYFATAAKKKLLGSFETKITAMISKKSQCKLGVGTFSAMVTAAGSSEVMPLPDASLCEFNLVGNASKVAGLDIGYYPVFQANDVKLIQVKAKVSDGLLQASDSLIFSKAQSVSLVCNKDALFACNPHPNLTQRSDMKARLVMQPS